MPGDNRTQLIVGAMALAGALSVGIISNWDKLTSKSPPAATPAPSTSIVNNAPTGTQVIGNQNSIVVPPSLPPGRVAAIQAELEDVGKAISIYHEQITQSEAQLSLGELQLSQFQHEKRVEMAEAQAKVVQEQRDSLARLKSALEEPHQRQVALERQLSGR